RKKRRWRQRKEQRLYLQLSDGLECLEHICREGCTTVGPYDVETAKKPSPCDKYATCQGVQMLIKHLVLCKRRASGVGCCRCNRMWQLLRLHSSICDHPDSCRVPLCRLLALTGNSNGKQTENEGGCEVEAACEEGLLGQSYVVAVSTQEKERGGAEGNNGQNCSCIENLQIILSFYGN
ncbi:hypothetical protein Gorai_010046, partial [Gossypium raimondii]|nr:hypothetical protein [Gossypium raimondii]